MTSLTDEELVALANRVRIHTINMSMTGKASHVGSSLSMVELLAVLYGRVLKYDPRRPDWEQRDRFLLSKGHACAAFYATLSECGFFPAEILDTFYQNGSLLAGHATHDTVPGIEISTGSLGHGLSIGAGVALAARLDGKGHMVFVMLSDGECDEGSVWEPALFAPHHGLDNLVVVVDYNKMQALGHTREVLDLEPLAEKWRAFNWSVREIDGHDVAEISEAFSSLPLEAGKPSAIIAHTVKGKGVSFMENNLLWHYRSPQGEEYEAAIKELKEKA